MTTEQEKLKPCPFCGGQVQLETVKSRAGTLYGVVCRNTGNRGCTCAMEQVPSRSAEAAIARWNMRKPMEELIAENERFDEGMRSIASSLGAGGYNAEHLSAAELVDKVRWGVDHLCDAHERRITELKAEIEALRKQVADDERKLDALLAHCDDGECGTCGQIICPHGDGMHFHHDGCPSCAQHEASMGNDDVPDFTPGNGNKARRRAEALGIDYNAATSIQVKE